MKLDSKECIKALGEYNPQNNVETLAIKVLLAKAEDVVNIPEMINITDEGLVELANVIRNIRDIVGINDVE